MAFPPVGVTAVIAGMAVFNRDAAVVENRLLRIQGAARAMEAQSVGSSRGAAEAFSAFASSVTTAGVVTAGAFALAGAASIKFAADFEEQLSLTQALTHSTKPEIEALGVAIIEMSRGGILGVEDLNKATIELARSGVDLPEIMGGALKAVQDLTVASGGEIGLEKAAKLTATAMNAFGISVDEVDRITTAATVVAQNSALTFTDFGTAVQYAAPSFKAAGFSIEDLAVAEALLGQKGVTGSVAATSLRGVIQRLIKPSNEAAKVMEQYGIHLFDAAGKSVGFEAVLQQLNHAFSDQAIAEGRITEEERLHAIATLGLQRTGAAFLILANATTEELNKLRSSFDTLKAADIVKVLMEPLNKQMAVAVNNVKAFALAFGGEFVKAFHDVTPGMVAFLQNIKLSVFSDLAQNILSAGAAIRDAFGAGVDIIRQFTDAFGLTDKIIDLLKSALIGIGLIILNALVPPALGAAAAFVTMAAGVGLVVEAVKFATGFLAGIADNFANFIGQFGPAGKAASDFSRGLGDSFRAVHDLLTGDFEGAVHHANLAFYEFTYTARNDGGLALQYVSDRLADAGAAFAPWASQAGDAGKAVSDSLSGVSGVVLSLQYILQGNFPAAANAAQGALASFSAAANDVGRAISSAIQPALTWITQVALPAIMNTLPSIGQAFTDAFSNLGILPQLQQIFANLQTSFGAFLMIVGNVASGLGELFAVLGRLAQGFGAAQTNNSLLTLAMTALLLPAKALITVWELLSAGLAFVTSVLAGGSVAFNDWAHALNATSPSVTGFTQVINDLNTRLQPVFNTIATVGAQAFATLLAAAQAVATAWPGIWNTVVSATTTAITTVAAIVDALPGTIQGMIATVTATVTGGWNAIQAATAAVWNAIPADIRASGMALIESVAQIYQGLATIVEAGLITAMEAINRFVQMQLVSLTNLAESARAIIQGEIDTAIGIYNSLVSLITGPLGQFEAALLGGLAAIAVAAETAALGIAGQIIAGVVRGIIGGISAVTGAINTLMSSAVSAARSTIDSHSPSRVFMDIGEDATDGLVEGIEDNLGEVEAAGGETGTALAQGVIDALDRMKAPVRASAAALVDQAINALTDIGNRADDLIASTQAKMVSIGEVVGRKINEAVVEAAAAIKDATQDAEDRISDAAASLGLSRSDRGRREALQNSQDARRQKRKQEQEDTDAAADHAKDLNAVELQLRQDLEKAQLKQEHELQQATTDARRKTINDTLADEVAAAKVKHDQQLADIQVAFEASEKDRMANRARQQSDADFERALEAETQKLNDDLEQEALDRTIERTNRERDQRITAINEALAVKQEKLRAQAAQELSDLHENINRRLATLEEEFAKKAADLLRKGGENMRPLVDNIQQILSGNFEAMRQSASDFEGSVRSAINALKDLDAQRARTGGVGAPALRDPAAGLDAVSDVPDPGVSMPPLDVLFPTLTEIGGLDSFNTIPTFGEGGVVPGPRGKPMLIVAHGGELVASLDSLAASLARGSSGAPSSSSTTHNYNLNATYPTYESPTSISMDMRAIIAMARG